MTITSRILNKKRHTVGYVIGRQEYTRAQAIKLARQGRISGVRVANGPQGAYLVSSTNASLYSLPTQVQQRKTRARATVAARTRKTSR